MRKDHPYCLLILIQFNGMQRFMIITQVLISVKYQQVGLQVRNLFEN